MKSKISVRLFLSHGLIGFLSFILTSVAPMPAEATFPGKLVAHWDLGQSDEVKDPDFIEIRKLVEKKAFDRALDLLEIKTRTPKTRPTALILKAILLNDMEHPITALKWIKEAFLMESHHPAVQFGFCQIHRNLGQADLARRACTIATQQHPNAPETYYELAQTLMALGEMKEAAKQLNQAVELAPQIARYHYEKGLIFTYFNNKSQAETSFLKALQIDSNDLDSTYQLAYLFATNGKTDRAKKHIDRILSAEEAHPKKSSARILADYINKRSTDKLPTRIDPASYHQSRSKAFYKSKKYGLSLLEIQTANRLKPNDEKALEILVGLSSILLRLEIAEPAVKRFVEKSADDNISRARAFQKLGDIKVLQGRLDEAKIYYQKAVELGDPNFLAKTALKELPEHKINPPPPLRPDKIYNTPADGLNRTGEIFANYGMFKSALGVYSMALKLNPKHLMAMLNIGAAHYKTKNYNRAVNTLEKVLITYPHHEHIEGHLLLLAQAYTQKGNLDEGGKNLKLLFQVNPVYKNIVKTDPIFQPLLSKSKYEEIFK